MLYKSKKYKDTYQVQFVDYGNQDTVAYSNMRQMPKKLFQFKDQCTKASLAYVRCCGEEDNCGMKAVEFFNSKTWEQKLMVKPLFKDQNYTYVMLYPRGKQQFDSSINYKMVRRGYAKMDAEGFQVPQNLQGQFTSAQEYAMTKQNGIWKFGGDFNEAEQDEDY